MKTWNLCGKNRQMLFARSVWLVAVLALGWMGCGGDSGGGSVDTPDAGDQSDTSDGMGEACTSSDTCGGGLCMDGLCQPCSDDAACAADGIYGDGATCTDGLCMAADTCDPGNEGCDCYSNGTCNVGLRCDSDLCVLCPEGEEGCACGAEGACGDGLVCTDELCVPSSCVDGADGCPCGAEDACDEGLICSDAGLCAPCALDIEGCPCEGACEGGLVCDDEEESCRAALTCDDLECADQQLCEEGEEGEDAICAEECEEGYVYNSETEECDMAMMTTNCNMGDPNSLLEQCTSENRACLVDGPMAMCGDCLPGFLDENDACRAVVTCMVLSCDSQNRDCTAATDTTDATCGACATGFTDNNGTCEAVPLANCQPEADLSILAQCQEANRICEENVGGAACGGCADGFIEDPNTMECIVPPSCTELGCAMQGRECSDADPIPACGGCVAGAVLIDPEDPEGGCRDLLTCLDVEPTCGADELCVEREGSDAVCSEWPCVYADGRPDTESAFREDTQECVFCGNECEGEGLTGSIWAYTRDNSNQCVCQTQEGYYFDVSGALLALPCDADGDGWVRSSARNFIESSEAALADNARCDLRSIDRFTLENEYQQRLDVFVCDDNAFVAATPCTENSECGEDGRCGADGRCTCIIDSTLDLYESVRNDDQGELDSWPNPLDIPSYDDGAVGRRLIASELNPLTRACISSNGDYNANEIADVTEWQGLSIAGADALTQSLTQFAFFVELHDGFYEDIIGSDFDRYVIREKSRCDADFPIQYNPTADEGDYWRSCTRNRDVDYNATLDNALINYDFAAWTCDQSAEGCPLVPPPTDITPDGEVPPHGLCDPEVTLPPVDGVWRGMNHHSQFKCIELVNTLPMERDADAPHQRLASDLTTSNGAEGTYQLNRCSVACPEGDADCTTDCQDGLCATTSEVAEDGSTRPIISCTPIGRSEVQDGEVGFAAMRFVPESNYERGCIDEWSPTQVVEEALPWKSLCPGYVTNPSGISAQANPGDFGKLVCGCGFNYGGPNCDQGCITSNLHYGGGNEEVEGECANGYCAVTAEGDGGRLGFWLCGESASTSYSGTEEGLEPKLRADGWVLGGDVSPMGIETTEMCQDSENCASGWSIHK